MARKGIPKSDVKSVSVKLASTGSSSLRKITAEEVLSQFKSAAGRGPIPDIVEVIPLVKELNEPFHGFFSRRNLREWAEAAKNSPPVRLRKSIIITALLALADAEHSISMMQLPPLIPELDRSSLYFRRADTMRALVAASVAAVNSLDETEEQPPRVPRVQWHDDAERLATVIKSVYFKAGRRRVSFGQPDAPAVSVLVWALERLGHSRTRDAVVQALRRSPRKV